MGANTPAHRTKRKDPEAAGRSMTPKQIRARARRNGQDLAVAPSELKVLMGGRDIEDWDLEELARGRPKNKNGDFSGAAPKWITRELHERCMELFKERVRTDMKSLTVKALDVLEIVLDDDGLDDKGKPTTPTNVKVDVAKFLLEHLIGKPTQPIQADISLKLQGILGAALVQPADMGKYVASSSHRVIDGVVEQEEDE